MKKQSKVITLISGFMVFGVSYTYADTCPTINSNQLRQLCRSKIIEKMGIAEAGHVTIGKVTLHNDSDTCTQDTSIKKFMKDRQKTYTGMATRHPSHPDKASCVYVVNKQPVIFTGQGVDLPARKELAAPGVVPPKSTEPKSPRAAPSVSAEEIREGDLVRAGELIMELKTRKDGKSPSYQEMLDLLKKEMVITQEKAENILEELGFDK